MKPGWTLNLFGLFLTLEPERISPEIINHERIHTAQMRELLFIPFYLIYGIEFLFRLAVTGSMMRAYLAMSFEREAYDNDADLLYLEKRRHFSQWRRKQSKR